LNAWTQGPALLQALNILENFDVKAMGYNSAKYIHTLYQAMNMAFADRDFYYGDTYFPPEEPVKGLLSKPYAKARAATMDHQRNDPGVKPGDPYPHQGGTNPFADLLGTWGTQKTDTQPPSGDRSFDEGFVAGTTSIQAADKEGWVVSITPSGGWIPAAIAGRTGIGMSQRMQSFVLDRAQGPYNVLEPGKRPRVTLTPSLALKDGRPYLSFAVQGGDTQDQNLLQFFLNVVEFGMNVQQAVESPTVTTNSHHASNYPQKAGDTLVLPKILADQAGNGLAAKGHRLMVGARQQPYGQQVSGAGAVKMILIDPQSGVFHGGVSPAKDNYVTGW
jgi:gamma-glutamyltranspeptidase / glutathione hydrolase